MSQAVNHGQTTKSWPRALIDRLRQFRLVFPAAFVYAVVFTAMTPLANNPVDRQLLAGTSLWLLPVAALLLLRETASRPIRWLATIIAFYPLTYQLRVLTLSVDSIDVSTFHLAPLFMAINTVGAALVVLLIVGADAVAARNSRPGRVDDEQAANDPRGTAD